MLPLTREQVRRVDQLAIQELGIPGVVLMENAGRGAAEWLLRMPELEDVGLPERDDLSKVRRSVAVLCGGGNNGGDGYVIARHLHNSGADVVIYAAKPVSGLAGDAAINAMIAQRMGLPIHPITTIEQVRGAAEAWKKCHVLVDALLGTGFTGQVRSPIREVIEACNQIYASRVTLPKIVAIDIPSGMDCDSGAPVPGNDGVGGIAIRADATITFVAQKVGFLMPSASLFLGEVVVVDIGAPPELVQRIAAGG